MSSSSRVGPPLLVLDLIEQFQRDIPDELKPRVGTFMLLDDTGQPRLETSYYVEPSDEPEESIASGGSDAGGDRQEAPVVLVEPPVKQASLSQALADELAIQRRDILAVHVAADPGLALDLAIFLMMDREGGYSSEKSGSSLVALPPSDPVFGFKTPDAAATRARAEATEALDRSWTAADARAGRFHAFRALPDEARAAWLGHAVARTLEASLNLPAGRVCPFHDHLGRLLGIDVAEWWRPTGANYFDRVPKSVTLAALEEIGGAVFARGYSKAKKAELSETAERIFAGQVAPAGVKERALVWVPDAMRFATAPEGLANVPDESPPWEGSSEDASDTAEVGSGAEEHSGEETAPPASFAPEGEACVGGGSSRRRRGSGKEADGVAARNCGGSGLTSGADPSGVALRRRPASPRARDPYAALVRVQ